MTVNVTLDFPADLENRIRQESPQLEAEMREAYVLELFRQGRLSHFDSPECWDSTAFKPTHCSNAVESSKAV